MKKQNESVYNFEVENDSAWYLNFGRDFLLLYLYKG
jgi:hypothetical protein